MSQSAQKITFAEVKQKILSVLEQKTKTISEPVSLIEGFASGPFSMELSDSVILGGPTIPMVMLIGNDSGRLYFFALRAILKDIEI